jgi:hypothetical protein
MNEALNNLPKRIPWFKRLGVWLWSERYTCFWSAAAGALLGFITMFLLRRKLLVIAVSLLAALGHGCQELRDGMNDLH